MYYLSSSEYDLMFEGEYEQYLSHKKKLTMTETVWFVARFLVAGISIKGDLTTFKETYYSTVENPSEDDLKSVMEFYEDMEDEIHDKRQKFLQSCDYDPSEGLDEMWCDEVTNFYSDLYFN